MGDITSFPIPIEVVETVEKILKRGNSVEVKKENGKLVIVEIKRKVQIKTSITG